MSWDGTKIAFAARPSAAEPFNIYVVTGTTCAREDDIAAPALDDKGKSLDGRCTATISGTTPAARFWTVTLYDLDGRLVPNPAERYGFTSQELARRADGTFEISISSRARAGNWLPTGGIDRYVVVLRLYDTPVGVATRTAKDAPMPSVSQACT